MDLRGSETLRGVYTNRRDELASIVSSMCYLYDKQRPENRDGNSGPIQSGIMAVGKKTLVWKLTC